MGKPKILDLSFEELAKIATALNENLMANKTRSKEERITTDHFIKDRFNIYRKDFGETCKLYGIQYNSKLGLYEIPGSNANAMQVSDLGQAKESPIQHDSCNANPKPLENSGRIEALLLQLIDMVKPQHEAAAATSPAPLVIDSTKLTGDVESHCMRFYEHIFVEFQKVCKSYPEFLNRDLVSLALLEFIEKYKKV